MKKWYQSKTIWMNVAGIVADALTLYASGGSLTALAIGGIVMRKLTKTGI